MIKNFFNGDRTFKSKMVFGRSPKLLATINSSFGSLNIREISRCPPGVDYNEWQAVHAVDFFNQANTIYGYLMEHCTQDTCPTMNAGPKYQYLWADGEVIKRPLKCSAPEYVDYLMTWIQKKLDDETIFPQKPDEPFGEEFEYIIKTIFKRLFRVYSHVYYNHFKTLEVLGVDSYLNLSFKHFIFFAEHFSLIEPRELKPLAVLIENFRKKEMEQEALEQKEKVRKMSISLPIPPRSSSFSKEKKDSPILTPLKAQLDSSIMAKVNQMYETPIQDQENDEKFYDHGPLQSQAKQVISKQASVKTDITDDSENNSSFITHASRRPSEAPTSAGSSGSATADVLDFPSPPPPLLGNSSSDVSQVVEIAEPYHEHPAHDYASDTSEEDEAGLAPSPPPHAPLPQPIAENEFPLVFEEPKPIVGHQEPKPEMQDDSQEEENEYKRVFNDFDDDSFTPSNDMNFEDIVLPDRLNDVNKPIEEEEEFESDEDEGPKPMAISENEPRTATEEYEDEVTSASAPRTADDFDSKFLRKLGTERVESGFWTVSTFGTVAKNMQFEQMFREFCPKIGIIGNNWEAQSQIQIARAAGYSVDILYSYSGKPSKLADEMNVEQVAGDIDELLKSGVDIILVCEESRKKSDTQFLDFLRKAKEQKTLVCISPLCLPLPKRKDVLSLVKNESQEDMETVIMHYLRSLPCVYRLREAIQMETCGKVISINVAMQNNWKHVFRECFSQPEDSDETLDERNHVLMKLAIAQLIDMICWLMQDSKVNNVFSRFIRIGESCDDSNSETNSDVANLQLQLANGVTVCISVSFVNEFALNKFKVEVIGTKGVLTLSDNKLFSHGPGESGRLDTKLLLDDQTVETTFQLPLQLFSSGSLHFFQALKLDMLSKIRPKDVKEQGKIQYEHLRSLFAPVSDGFRNMRVIEAIRRQRMMDLKSFVSVAELLKKSPKAIRSSNDKLPARASSVQSDSVLSPSEQPPVPPPRRRTMAAGNEKAKSQMSKQSLNPLPPPRALPSPPSPVPEENVSPILSSGKSFGSTSFGKTGRSMFEWDVESTTDEPPAFFVQGPDRSISSEMMTTPPLADMALHAYGSEDELL